MTGSSTDYADQFQSTLPVGGATRVAPVVARAAKISIHAPRGGERQLTQAQVATIIGISIHAPRGGSDWPLSARRT